MEDAFMSRMQEKLGEWSGWVRGEVNKVYDHMNQTKQMYTESTMKIDQLVRQSDQSMKDSMMSIEQRVHHLVERDADLTRQVDLLCHAPPLPSSLLQRADLDRLQQQVDTTRHIYGDSLKEIQEQVMVLTQQGKESNLQLLDLHQQLHCLSRSLTASSATQPPQQTQEVQQQVGEKEEEEQQQQSHKDSPVLSDQFSDRLCLEEDEILADDDDDDDDEDEN